MGDFSTILPFEDVRFGRLRALLVGGEPWFVAKDICDALGIRTDTVRKILDTDEVSDIDPNTIGVKGHNPLIISEAGLYSLILKSRKPGAKAFKRWVTHEVLPAIRKHDGYMTPAKGGGDACGPGHDHQVGDRPEERARALP